MNKVFTKSLLALSVVVTLSLTSCVFIDKSNPTPKNEPVQQIIETPVQPAQAPVVEPEPVPVTKPEPAPAPKPKPKTEPKPKAEPKPAPAPKPETKVEPAPAPEPEKAPITEPTPVETKPAPAPVQEPEPEEVEEDFFGEFPDEEELSFVFSIVDTPAKFPGGESALKNYLSKNVKTPASAKKNNVHGRVVLSAIVKDNGKIVNVEVIEALDPACDAAAMRALYDMPRWTPATLNGEPVHSEIEIPVTF